MRLAQLALFARGGTAACAIPSARTILTLSEALVAAGHDVTLFNNFGSRGEPRVIQVWPEGVRFGEYPADTRGPLLLILEEVRRHANEFDLMHSHSGCFSLPSLSRQNVHFVTTVHDRLDWPERQRRYSAFPSAALVSAANAQRRQLLRANGLASVPYCLPVKSSTAGARRSSGYSAYLEALTPDSRVDIAVRIAANAGVPIKVAGKLRSRGDKAPYRQKLAPSLRHPHVEYVGEVEELQKQDFLCNACALLMPGKEQVIAMEAINAMAVSRPVIAFDHGPASEVVQDRISGLVVADEPQAVAAIQRSFDMDRSKVRGVLEQCFCSAALTTQYLRIYERLSIRKRYPLRLSARARLHEFLAHSFVSQEGRTYD